MKRRERRAVLFTGCRPEVAAGPDGRVLATGAAARAAAGTDAEVHELAGTAWPGLTDAHIHLQWLAQLKLSLDLTVTHGIAQALDSVREFATRLPPGAFVIGRGWIQSRDEFGSRPDRRMLDEAAGGRPAILRRRDGHSAWLSSAALAAAGIARGSSDPPGGVVERDEHGEPTGIVTEKAVEHAERVLPEPADEELASTLRETLQDLARLGLTSVHAIDPVRTFSLLQRLREQAELPLRVTYNFPVSELPHLERIGMRSGWGDDYLRVWGVKAFLDGSLGSDTAEMLDGSGVTVMPQDELQDVTRRCAQAELNVLLHAIGDRAVRRALDALEPLTAAWRYWRPRIEHAQCVHPDDMPRFAAVGAVASMQPIHAIADRELADAKWGERTARSYAWRPLREAGAELAFGSDAPIESADPLLGLDAAIAWRRKAGWHPNLALSKRDALAAYTRGAAFAVGLEREAGSLRVGNLCDLTVVDKDGVAATIVGGRLTWRRSRSRRPATASPSSGRGAR